MPAPIKLPESYHIMQRTVDLGERKVDKYFILRETPKGWVEVKRPGTNQTWYFSKRMYANNQVFRLAYQQASQDERQAS